MLEGTKTVTIIAAMVTSLENWSNPKRTPKHRDDPRPNRKPRFMLSPSQELGSNCSDIVASACTNLVSTRATTRLRVTSVVLHQTSYAPVEGLDVHDASSVFQADKALPL